MVTYKAIVASRSLHDPKVIDTCRFQMLWDPPAYGSFDQFRVEDIISKMVSDPAKFALCCVSGKVISSHTESKPGKMFLLEFPGVCS
jgi:hypothetical protein